MLKYVFRMLPTCPFTLIGCYVSNFATEFRGKEASRKPRELCFPLDVGKFLHWTSKPNDITPMDEFSIRDYLSIQDLLLH
jgi:hypothetical protein